MWANLVITLIVPTGRPFRRGDAEIVVYWNTIVSTVMQSNGLVLMVGADSPPA